MNREEQNAIFDRLSEQVGRDAAVFCLCAVFDLPFDPEREAETWEEYLQGASGGRFADGVTDVNAAILAGMDRADQWQTVWGEGYSEADYKQLDALYRTMTAQLDSTGGIDLQQQDAARTCARMALNRNKLISNFRDKDSIATANTLDKMIRENLKDANMRKADILPSAAQKLHTIVDVLRTRLGLRMEMTQDEVFAAFYKWLRSKKYPMTLDAAEHIVMLILNLMQKNDDRQELSSAPEEMDFNPYASEFATVPSEAEEEAYQYGGFLRGEWHREE